MKRDFLIFLVLFVFLVSANAWGQCPGVPPYDNDNGVCDSFYIECPDTLLSGDAPYIVRVPIYMTHDMTAEVDSLAGMVFPLCYTKMTNTAKYCSLSSYRNATVLSGSALSRSIFAHLVIGSDTTHNWMQDLYLQGQEVGEEWGWANIIRTLDGTSYFWLSMIPTTQPCMGAVTHTLIATMTFKLEDSMTICIDSCFWPPSSRLNFSRKDANTFFPRLGTPHNTTPPEDYTVCYRFRLPSDVKQIQGSEESKPTQFSLSQNYPNPFNPITNFQFTLPKSTHVKIEIFNIVGQKVNTLMDQDKKPGVYVVDWDGKDESGNSVSTGVYFYKVQAGDFSDMKRMVLLK